MKLLDWIQGWVRSWRPGSVCYFCGARESQVPSHRLYEYEDVLACDACLDKPWYALERDYWWYHPEKVPPCKHCGLVLPPEDVEPMVRRAWIFCQRCAGDSDVRLYWERISRRLSERRARS